MAEKWFNVATHALKDGDEVELSWHGTTAGKFGYIVMSKERLLFVEEHGFMHHTARVILNLPYQQIYNYTLENHHQLELATTDGTSRYIASPHIAQVTTHLKLRLTQGNDTNPTSP